MATARSSRPSWISQHAARIGAGHFALAQGEDGAWRVALVDEWLLGGEALQAAFDAVHPDGSLDFCGEFLNRGHLPQDLGRADAFFGGRARECALVDELWEQDAEAMAILANAHERWRAWAGRPLPALIRAKAVHRLRELSSGRAPTPEGAKLALAGALQENIELCAWRARDVPPDLMAKVDESDALPSKARRGSKRPAAKPAKVKS